MTRFDLDDISLGAVDTDGSYPGGSASTAPADAVDAQWVARADAQPRFDDELVGLFQQRVRLDRMAWDCTVGGLAVFIIATVVAMYALALPSAWPDAVSLYARPRWRSSPPPGPSRRGRTRRSWSSTVPPATGATREPRTSHREAVRVALRPLRRPPTSGLRR